ncbi:hypothetical protein NPIL_451711 [Nephila pilipes]|uniref:Uncharacterized protein n=1 Tax=Nephila pilipes TaxID=299642 RepID=A0A8X6TG33_NEPPI|nr:hypothetical protein NPIL_451711 [Nephila pilipes]
MIIFFIISEDCFKTPLLIQSYRPQHCIPVPDDPRYSHRTVSMGVVRQGLGRSAGSPACFQNRWFLSIPTLWLSFSSIPKEEKAEEIPLPLFLICAMECLTS